MLPVVTVTALLALAAPQAPRTTLPLAALTVPSDRLPDDCRLTPESNAATATPSGQVQFAPPAAGLAGVRTNPWMGDTAAIVAAIRERMEGTPRVADAGTVTPAGAARFRLKWADGISEAYAAGYDGDASGRVVVHAVRIAEEAARPTDPRRPRDVRRIDLGDVVAFVYGQGRCADTVAEYLSTLR